MNKLIKSVLFAALSAMSTWHVVAKHNDVTICSHLDFRDGLARLPIVWIDTFSDQLKVNFKPSSSAPIKLDDVPLRVQKIVKSRNHDFGKVILVNTLFWFTPSEIKRFPQHSIKIAYTMHESSKIPSGWSQQLNTLFDAAVVPDQWLKVAYKQCGVKIPIFVLPLPVYLEEFLQEEPKALSAQEPFTFGMTGAFFKRKNHTLLLQAFYEEFGNDPQVKLKLHGRYDFSGTYEEVAHMIEKFGLTNVELLREPLAQQEYIKWMKSLDCYAFISAGEGFSITPREAMALGIPVILSNNTAHKVMCDSGYVRSVQSDQLIPAYYEVFKEVCGNQFNPTLRDVRKALRDIYENQTQYKRLAQASRNWVKRYLPENLKNQYISLIKPKKISLGSSNSLKDEMLITNSKKLYNKYCKFIQTTK